MIRGAARRDRLGLVGALCLLCASCSSSTESLLDDAGGVATGGASAGAPSAGGSGPTPSGGATQTGGATSNGGSTASGGSAGAAKGGTATGGNGGVGGDAPRVRQKLEPEAGKTLLFVGQDTGEIESYAQAFGMPGGVMLYSNVWDGLGVLSASDFGGYGESNLGHWKAQSSQFLVQVGLDLDHGQNCGTCGGCSRHGYLEELARGDAARLEVVRSLINALRDSGHPVLLRVGYEFDAEICPGGFGKYPMQAYQQAFQRVHQLVKESGAKQIALVWAAWAFQSRDPGKAIGVAPWGWYPGDDVVDWIGVSVFPGYAEGDPTEQYQADKRRQVAEFAKRHGKPMMIAEATPRARFAPSKGDAAWNGWYAGVFDYIEQNDIKAFCYINMNWEALGMWKGQGWGDTRAQGSPVAEKWKSAVNAPRFLKSHDGLYAELMP